jgi:hypothetical protein
LERINGVVVGYKLRWKEKKRKYIHGNKSCWRIGKDDQCMEREMQEIVVGYKVNEGYIHIRKSCWRRKAECDMRHDGKVQNSGQNGYFCGT